MPALLMLFHRAETEECTKIPLWFLLLIKVKEMSRRKADPNSDLQDDFGGKRQGIQEKTWDSD